MARRRRKNIGFQPGDDTEKEAPNPIHPPWGSVEPAKEDFPEKPLFGDGKVAEDLLPKFGSLGKDVQNLNTEGLANQPRNDGRSDLAASTFSDYLSSVNTRDELETTYFL